MHKAEEYTYRVFWSDEDEAFIGTVAEFPRLSHFDGTRQEAFDGIVELVSDVMGDMEEDGEELPEPFGKRSYSGRIVLRMTPEQHRRIAMEAAEQGVSINTLLVSRI